MSFTKQRGIWHTLTHIHSIRVGKGKGSVYLWWVISASFASPYSAKLSADKEYKVE